MVEAATPGPARVPASTADPVPAPSVPLMVDETGGVYLATAHGDALTRIEAKLDAWLKAHP